MHKGEETYNISSFPLHSISKNNIFDPIVMMVQKLIKFFKKFLGLREEIGSPLQEHSYYYFEMVMMVQKLINKLINFLGSREEIGSPFQEHSFYYLGPKFLML